ncbi:TetR/AcrR family transcriptional regulator [Rhizorhabdus wittichii]|uniref:TetR/AcrR family transcriptional regulator n=1 Tax=Rhizorhabdus wittichii TaxID=160791 RepID=UPI0002DBAB01|nr:TetR/AcrR family transcriptional regulator [Rhizorhabdus wittichii]
MRDATTTTTATATGRRYTQARGRARREALIQAARDLLQEREIDDITLPMVSEAANIPSSSTYHFFPDLRELYKELARTISDEMASVEPAIGADASWQAIIGTFLAASADYFNADAAARQLILGPRTTPDIRQAGCHDDYRFGVQLHAALAAHFHLPELAEPIAIFFRAIVIADAFFALSVLEDGVITRHMVGEANRAATAYLGNYLPPILQRKRSH